MCFFILYSGGVFGQNSGMIGDKVALFYSAEKEQDTSNVLSFCKFTFKCV